MTSVFKSPLKDRENEQLSTWFHIKKMKRNPVRQPWIIIKFMIYSLGVQCESICEVGRYGTNCQNKCDCGENGSSCESQSGNYENLFFVKGGAGKKELKGGGEAPLQLLRYSVWKETLMSFICLQADVFANKVSLDPDAIDHVRKVSMESDVSKLASLALQVSNQTEKKRITNEINYC